MILSGRAFKNLNGDPALLAVGLAGKFLAFFFDDHALLDFWTVICGLFFHDVMYVLEPLQGFALIFVGMILRDSRIDLVRLLLLLLPFALLTFGCRYLLLHASALWFLLSFEFGTVCE